MNHVILKTAASMALLALPLSANAADVMPKKGQTMAQVRSQLGEPGLVLGPVGTPAITTWEFNGFCVYFENDRVITSVAD